MKVISYEVTDRINTFNSQAIAKTVWVFEKVGDSIPNLFETILHKGMEKVDTLRS